jgi:hypothetical protein
MARKVGQIIARGDRRWLIRVYLGRDHETNKRNYHNRTIHGSMREVGAKITLNEYLDRWLETAVKLRVREKTCQDYEGILRRYVRPNLGERVLATIHPLDLHYTPANDRARSVCSNGPLHARCVEVCDAASFAMAVVA